MHREITNNKSMSAQSRIFGLDLLRTVAILLVCLLHGREFLTPYFPSFPDLWFVDGVDLFFCLSGFLIGRIFINEFSKTGSFGINQIVEFWKRRWFRTLPNFYLILTLNLGFHLVRNKNLNIDGLWRYPFFLQNFNVVRCFHFFTESWSLAVEEWFYLGFPIFCVLLSLFIKRSIQRIVLTGTVLIIFGSIIARNLIGNQFPNLDIFTWIKEFRDVVIFRVDSIVYGVLGAYFSIYYSNIWLKYKNSLIVFGIIGLGYLFEFYPVAESNFYKMNYDVLCSIFILSTLPFLSTWNIDPKNTISKIVTFISKISYSMYLINASLVFNFINIYNRAESGRQAVINYFIFWIVTISFSFLIYQYFERPTTALRDKKVIL